MSDIDFDELDRAVASVLGKDEAPDTAATPVAVTVTPPQRDVTAPAPEPRPVAAQSLHAQPIKPVQRGRFLDMVQPTGSMVQSRQAVVVTPLSRTAPAANGAFVSDVIAPAPVAAVPPAEPKVVQPAPAPVSPPDAQIAPQPAPDFFAASPDDAAPHVAPEIQTSPFIPDAKVEKRPLGAWSGGDKPAGEPVPTESDLHRRISAIESDDNVSDDIASADSAAAAAPAAKAFAKSPSSAPAAVKKPAPLTIAKGEKLPKHGSGAFIWITVAIAVLLIGFGVGATLYFKVLQ